MTSPGIVRPERYLTKVFLFEYFIPMFSILSHALELTFGNALLIYLSLMVCKWKVEGLRINTPLFVLPVLTQFAGAALLTILSSLLSIYVTHTLVVYNLPPPEHTLSYKTVTSKDDLFTVFYPTQSTKNISKISLFNSDVGKRMFDVLNKDPGKPSKYPQAFIEMASDYYTKMSLGNVVPSASCVQKEYQLIIISHQLGFNSLYSLARQFVDSGYLVMLVDHPQQIRNIHPDATNPVNRQFRTSQLVTRYKAIVKSLDFILDDALVHDLLGPKVRINKNKVHILGHSFGGSTALYSAMKDSRITGSVISLDPCFFIFEDSYTLFPCPLSYSSNTLILLAEDYYLTHYDFFQNDYRAKMIRDNCKNVRILRMLGSNHANFSELSLFTAGQFQRFRVVRNKNVRLYFEMFIALSHQMLRSEEAKDEEEIVGQLMQKNPKYRKEIMACFRSILKEEHARLAK